MPGTLLAILLGSFSYSNTNGLIRIKDITLIVLGLRMKPFEIVLIFGKSFPPSFRVVFDYLLEERLLISGIGCAYLKQASLLFYHSD